MKLKTLTAAAALLTAANTYAVGPGNLGNIDNQTITIGETHAGVFNDTYTFEVSGTGASVGSLLSGTPDVQIFGIGFFDSAFNLLTSDQDGSDGFASFTLLNTPGTYHFSVVGVADGGSYTGFLLTRIPTAVPEPETYALMLAGLGVVGWASRRRKRA